MRAVQTQRQTDSAEPRRAPAGQVVRKTVPARTRQYLRCLGSPRGKHSAWCSRESILEGRGRAMKTGPRTRRTFVRAGREGKPDGAGP